ncbi:MAG: hypothetical protein AAF725_15870 [Acidobacteriota bacterium]
MDRAPSGAVVSMRLTQSSWLNREKELPAPLAVEMMAQAVLVLLSEEAEGGKETTPPPPAEQEGWPALAGIDSVSFAEELARSPLQAGDVVEAESSITGRFGAMTKVESVLRRGGRVIVEASLLLVAAS